MNPYAEGWLAGWYFFEDWPFASHSEAEEAGALLSYEYSFWDGEDFFEGFMAGWIDNLNADY